MNPVGQLRERLPEFLPSVHHDRSVLIKWKQQDMGFPDFGLDYTNPDFVRFAESHGAAGVKVDRGDDLGEILKKAFEMRRFVVVECPIDYSVNYETFSKEIEDLVCEM